MSNISYRFNSVIGLLEAGIITHKEAIELLDFSNVYYINNKLMCFRKFDIIEVLRYE